MIVGGVYTSSAKTDIASPGMALLHRLCVGENGSLKIKKKQLNHQGKLTHDRRPRVTFMEDSVGEQRAQVNEWNPGYIH